MTGLAEGTVLRPATDADVAVVHALEQELFGDDAWSEAAVREELTGPRRVALVAVTSAGEAGGGAVVGYVVTAAAGEVTDVHRIGVHPAHQRRGVARSLLGAALAGADQVLLEVAEGNRAATGLYTATGFAEIARRHHYYRDGSDALVLQRRKADA